MWNRVLLLSVATCVSATGEIAFSQQIPPPLVEKQDTDKPSEILKIYRMQHSPAYSLEDTLTRVFVGANAKTDHSPRFVADRVNNRLIVSANAEAQERVAALLRELDVARKKEDSEVQVFRLKHVDPAEVQRAIRDLSIAEGTPNFADSRTRTLYVRTPRESVERISQFVKSLDKPPAEESAADILIRVVWLASASLTAEKAAPVPKDLEPLIDQLRKKAAIGEMRTAAELYVNVDSRSTQPTQPCVASGIANLSKPAILQFNGTITRRKGDDCRMTVEITATDQNQNPMIQSSRHGEICKLVTRCSLREEKPFVIGMTPASNAQPTIFVIQAISQ